MKIYLSNISIGDKLIAFEIDTIYASKAKIANILSPIKGVTKLKVRKAFSKSDEVLIWFDYENNSFIVWEPYGDSSRYWIGPENPDGFTGDITPVADAFKIYKPSLLRRVLGGIVSFNFSTT